MQPTIDTEVIGDRVYVNVKFPDWEDDGDDPGSPDLAGRIRPRNTTIYINGCPIHLEAIEVHRVDSIQEVVNETWTDEFDALCTVYPPDGGFQTATINGREYVVYATSHGE